MKKQTPPFRNPAPQGAVSESTPIPYSVTPFSPGVPLDILHAATRRISELVDQTAPAGVPLTLRQILHDAIVNAYQRGKTEERAEANLLMESMDKINNRRHERLTELVIAQCMDALGLSNLMLDLSKNIDGKVTAHLDAAQRHIVVYTYEEPDHED